VDDIINKLHLMFGGIRMTMKWCWCYGTIPMDQSYFISTSYTHLHNNNISRQQCTILLAEYGISSGWKSARHL